MTEIRYLSPYAEALYNDAYYLKSSFSMTGNTEVVTYRYAATGGDLAPAFKQDNACWIIRTEIKTNPPFSAFWETFL